MSEEQQQQKAKRHPPFAWFVITTTVEWAVLGEILWYYLHDGEQTLHEALWEFSTPLREHLRHRSAVRRTLFMIRNLPETE